MAVKEYDGSGCGREGGISGKLLELGRGRGYTRRVRWRDLGWQGFRGFG